MSKCAVSARSTSCNAATETTRDKIISVTHRHVPMVLRGEHHWHNNNCFASFSDQCVSDLTSSTLARLSCSVPRFHTFPMDSGWCQSLWRNDHDSPALLRMEERHSNVVSGNQTIVLSLRICFRCSLTHNDSGRFHWWCRLRDILAGVRVHLCCNQSAPDRFWILWRPFHVVQPLPVDTFKILGSGFFAAGWVPPPPASRCSQALSVDLHTPFCVSSRVPLLAP